MNKNNQPIIYGKSWTAHDLRLAFWDGATWWHYVFNSVSMSNEDRSRVEAQAEARYFTLLRDARRSAQARLVWAFCCGILAGVAACVWLL